MSQAPIIVLDRDGVINEDSDHYIKSPDEWLPVSGSLEAIARLSKAGFRIAVATNQSGLARGYFDEYGLARIHQKMLSLVEAEGGHIDTICYCPHSPDDGCTCRKPGTGLLEQISMEFQQPLAGATMVGDSIKDLQAAQAFGLTPVLVRSGKGKSSEGKLGQLGFPVDVYDTLSSYVDTVLG
ncbi:MAG: D-glycero-beta-D-manno-heptose 1,7-bisphosphate 7-phosphatase [Pseudomonadales bacterium]|nr:D-glycero-beta-D-manno-heptose 1,7-bisphosphate 7-phosphatase [Pseudomonadales bacterium]